MIVGLMFAIHPSYVRNRFSSIIKDIGIEFDLQTLIHLTKILQRALKRLKNIDQKRLENSRCTDIVQEVKKIVSMCFKTAMKDWGNIDGHIHMCSKEIEKKTGLINVDPLDVYYNPESINMHYCRKKSVTDIMVLELITFYMEYMHRYPTISQADSKNITESFNTLFSACEHAISELCEKNKLGLEYEYYTNEDTIEKYLRKILLKRKESDMSLQNLRAGNL